MSGVESVLFSVDGARNESWEPSSGDPSVFSASFPFVGEGMHSFSWTAFDNAGNATHGTETFVVDNTAPVTTSDVVANYVGGATIHLAATDNSGGSGVAHTFHSVDGQPPVEGLTVTVAAPSVGSVAHTIEYWSVDGAGNEELPHVSAPFTVKAKTATSTTLKASASTLKVGKYVTLTAKLNGGPFVAGTTVRFERRASSASTYTLAKTVVVNSSGVATYRYKLTSKGTRYHRVRFMGDATHFASPIVAGLKLVVK